MLGGALSAQSTNLLPQPQQLEHSGGSVDIRSLRLNGERWSFVERLCGSMGVELNAKADKVLCISLVDSISGARVNQNEAYRLSVSDKGVELEAVTEQGVYWALSTLKQLITTKGKKVVCEKCVIVDWPAFRVRGFMQDVGRSYVSTCELKREIAKLSEYKINVFHLHVTENQSWRMESKIYPELNDSINTTRMAGKYYTHSEARELVSFCKEHNMMLIPEFDMPGHSAAFQRTFGCDMQSERGMSILKELIAEVCEVFDVPYLHIGTDEVAFTNPTFVPEMVAFVRAKGKKVISWNPGWHYTKGEIDMTHLWSYRGKAQEGIAAIDSKFHYLNHFDAFADIVALYRSRIYDVCEGSDDIAGSIMALWHDRYIEDEVSMIAQNNFYPNMLAFAERAWLGGGTEYFNDKGTVLDTTPTADFLAFEDFERRMLYHKDANFEGYPFYYVKQTDVRWNITDAFPNGGDLAKVFPPEEKVAEEYHYQDSSYMVREAVGNAVYLRHVWGTFVPSFYASPKPNHTAYAYTWVYSPKNQSCGMWISFQDYSRSESDLAPQQGTWDYKGSKIWLNDEEILPPLWTNTHTVKDNETPLGNENFAARTPTPIKLNKGWNYILIKLPIGEFSHPSIRLTKWMFTAAIVSADGKNSVEGLVYSTDKH